MAFEGIARDEARTLGEFVELTTAALAAQDPAARPVFRGMAAASWHLETSLDRLWKKARAPPKRQMERGLLESFRQRAHPFLKDDPGTRWYPLMMGQHYGLPTRLLDWTFSPLVAAHFATLPRESGPETDRVVWVLDWRRVHKRFKFRAEPFTLQRLRMKLSDGLTMYQKTITRAETTSSFAFLIDPPLMEPRVGAQMGAFSVTTDLDRSFDEFLRAHGLADALRRIVVPADRVARVRDQLDVAGVLERDLFPDLEGITRELRRRAAKPREGVVPVRTAADP